MASMLSRNKNLKPAKKSMDEHAEDALYREISEEVQAQKMYDFAKKYMRWLIAGAIAIFLITVGIQLYRHYKHEAKIVQAREFEAALDLAQSGDFRAADEAFARAAAKISGGMGDLALFKSAVMDLQSGKGSAKMEQLAKKGATRDFRDLALIHVAVMNANSMDGAQFEKFMSPVLSIWSPFYYTGMLLVAQKYLAEDNVAAANKWLDKIISDKNAPASVAGMAESLR
ncbi:MAG: tetratricopeptide repeat protein [Alphaproteobacteria bacterium]|nr:tetratricopeptide repeat protein [Alphaproteobacteria bacterium]